MPLIIYGLRQAKGQFQIIQDKVPVQEALNSDAFTTEQKAKLQLINKIKAFAYSALNLKNLNQYHYFFDQKGQPGMYIVTACEPYQLQAFEWKAGFLGNFSYKGFFSKAHAKNQEAKWKSLGLDTDIGITNAWSTLGWFEDPIMSSFLDRDPGELARVIIHEITHGTLFVKDDLTFNENLATFIGDIGAEQFLMQQYGAKSMELKTYQNFLSDRSLYKSFMLKKAKELDAFYQRIQNQPLTEKAVRKEEKLKQIIKDAGKLDFKDPQRYRWLTNPKELPNNTLFTDFLTYNSSNARLDSLYRTKYNSNIAEMIEGLKKKYGK